MVNVLKNKLLNCLLIMLMASGALAQSKLSASVDRNKIYENDTLNLTLSGQIEMEFSFGGLMNFGRNQIQAPELDALEKDFEVLDQNQNYSMRTINGDTKAEVTWNYTLAPKRTGQLTIPALAYQGTRSEPLTIEVLAGKAPRNADTPPLVFIEAEVDKKSAYVQEQVLYTLRLYAADHLASGDLSMPEPDDAIVESLGETKKYYRMAYNQRYEVRERQYLLFPQKSGELTIDAQSFNGMLIDTRTRRRMRVRETSETVTLEIKPPPVSFSGKTWLPATSFEITEKWDKEPYGLRVGDSVTRTLEMKALGLLGSALPPVGTNNISGMKVYPDQPEVESYEHDSGVQSQRIETSALVAINPIKTELPEIQIAWWDTVNDVERVAVIPSRAFEIAPNPEQAQASPPNVNIPAAGSTESSLSSGTKQDDAIANNASPFLTPGEAQVPQNNQPWYLIIALLIIGWISTTWLLLKRQADLTKMKSTQAVGTSDHLYPELTKAIKNRSPEWPKLLVSWLGENDYNVHSIDDINSIDDTIFKIAKDFETQLYSPTATSEIKMDHDLLLKRLKALKKPIKTGNKSNSLQPMYP